MTDTEQDFSGEVSWTYDDLGAKKVEEIVIPENAEVAYDNDTMTIEYITDGVLRVVKIPEEVLRRLYKLRFQVRDKAYWDGYFDRLYQGPNRCDKGDVRRGSDGE